MKTATWPTASAGLMNMLALTRRCGWGSLLLWVLWVLPAAALEMRVAVQGSVNAVDVGTSTPGVLLDGRGEALYQVPQLQRLTIETDLPGQLSLTDGRTEYAEASTFWLEPGDDGLVWIGDRWYRGRVQIIPTAEGLVAVNHVDLEEYLYSVVGSEMPASWPQAALQAQAVAARSYAVYHRGRAANRAYDMGGTTTWQVYRGFSGEASTTRAAVDATAGQVITYAGQVIEAVFHSSSGGHTENSEDVWSSAVPYLKGVRDFDENAPVFQWDATFSLTEASGQLGDIGQIEAIEIVSRSGQNRAAEVLITGDTGETAMRGNDLRRALGLRSTKIDSITVDPSQDLLLISGRGFGHGIGLSQWGARGMAEQGHSYDHILGHYYQGTQLSRIE
ncbi:MAG: SpoIID/LytB domain-containing protein [Cyanobacteria bacterium J06648_16]